VVYSVEKTKTYIVLLNCYLQKNNILNKIFFQKHFIKIPHPFFHNLVSNSPVREGAHTIQFIAASYSIFLFFT